MSKTNLGTIHDQTDLMQTLPLGLQPLAGDWLVPLPYAGGRVIQKSAQSSGGAHQLRRTRNFACNLVQIDRLILIDPNRQPDKVPNLGNSLIRSKC